VAVDPPCRHCLRANSDTKITVRNGFTIILVRFGLEPTPTPDVRDLDRYLLSLLAGGKGHTPAKFPRIQVRPDREGLVSLQRLGRRERWEFAHSVASLKRNLPSGCRLHAPSKRSQWSENAFSSHSSSPEYLAFVRREITRLFPSWWDRRYGHYVGKFLPNASARFCKTRADFIWKGRQEEFRRLCTSETELPTCKGRYKEVLSAGKVRPLIIYNGEMDLLGPLHQCLDAFMAKHCKWRLFGPPTAKVISSVCQYENQISIDLVSATDNLCIDVAETVLDCLFFKAVEIPRAIRKLAHDSLHPLVDGRPVTHGQMMGSYLSFPLLCLQSWLAARWATRDCEANILVNGDDTLISASSEVRAVDYPPGFQLNERKTIFSKNVAELNSTSFLRRGGKWHEVRHLRRGGALNDYQGLLHMARACSSAAWTDAFIRSRIGNRWGLMPSQIGLTRTRCAYRREISLRRKRNFTDLPEPVGSSRNPDLQLCRGCPEEVEIRALTDYFFRNGRDGHGKRDAFNPSKGEVRRTFSWRKAPPWKSLSYKGWSYQPSLEGSQVYFVPVDFVTPEEEEGLRRLAVLRMENFGV